jgi:mediator of RNA polymerase II transcription subunit 12
VEENHRHYHSLVRLIKKEIGDKQSQSMKYLRQLLPFPKQMDEVKNRFIVAQNSNWDPL